MNVEITETTFRCPDCGATETYDPSDGWYLLTWYALSSAFEERHRACGEVAG